MMKAKMVVGVVETIVCATHGETIQENLSLRAVGRSEGYGNDGLDENNTFARFTPMAEFKLTISNPPLFGKFKQGQIYYVDFTKVSEE